MPGKKGNDGSPVNNYWDDNDRVTSRIEGDRSRKKLSTAVREKSTGRVNPNVLMTTQPKPGTDSRTTAQIKSDNVSRGRVGAKMPSNATGFGGYGPDSKRITSRTGNQIPNPVEEFGRLSTNYKKTVGSAVPQPSNIPEAAKSRQVKMASERIGAKIPTSDTLVATRGVRSAAIKRLAQTKKKGK